MINTKTMNSRFFVITNAMLLLAIAMHAGMTSADVCSASTPVKVTRQAPRKSKAAATAKAKSISVRQKVSSAKQQLNSAKQQSSSVSQQSGSARKTASGAWQNAVKAIALPKVAPAKGSDEFAESELKIGDNPYTGEVYTVAEQMPSFPGGENAMLNYIASHLRYPSVSEENGVHGLVMVRFVVLPSGRVGEVKVIKGLDRYCDREAERVIRRLPLFIPGKKDGKPVAVWYTAPVQFVIGSQEYADETSDVDVSMGESSYKGKVYTVAEQMPHFPGDESSMLDFIAAHLRYPSVSLQNGVQGRVMVRFVVLPSGEVGDVQVIKGLDRYCDREAVRVIKTLPKFIPGKQGGKPVAVWYTAPVQFVID